jgi:hypothetical protein
MTQTPCKCCILTYCIAAPESPGPGGLGPELTFGGTGPRMGPPRSKRPQSAHPAPPSSPYLTAPSRKVGPAYSFGTKRPLHDQAPPGDTGLNYLGRPTMTKNAASWGPAPKLVRPASAPAARKPEPRSPYVANGPSFGLLLPKDIEISPGPLDYPPVRPDESYVGPTIKHKTPMFYGKVTNVTPGPKYHVDCSLIGVATADHRKMAIMEAYEYGATSGWR